MLVFTETWTIVSAAVPLHVISPRGKHFSLNVCAWYRPQCVSVLLSLRDYSDSLTPIQAPDWTETSWSLRSQHLLPYHLESRRWHGSDGDDGEDVKKEQRRKRVEVARLAYELYIKTVRMTEERQEWVEVVQSHSMCQRLFLFFFFSPSLDIGC